MKSDLSLGDLKKQKKAEKFYKKELLKIRNFLILKLPMRPELVSFMALSLLDAQN